MWKVETGVQIHVGGGEAGEEWRAGGCKLSITKLKRVYRVTFYILTLNKNNINDS